jgi:hypothetical protein
LKLKKKLKFFKMVVGLQCQTVPSPGSVKLLSLYTRPPGTSTSNLYLERKGLFSSHMDKLNQDEHKSI